MKCNCWEERTLGDIATIIMGQSPKGDTLNVERIGIPFIQGNRTFGFLSPTIDTYTTSPTKMAEVGDVIMSVRAPVGDLNIASVPFCLGRGLCSIRSKNCESTFLYYLMKAHKNKLVSAANGTVFSSVSRNEISNLIVSIPPSEKNRNKIAKILFSIDQKIILNNRINDYLAERCRPLKRQFRQT